MVHVVGTIHLLSFLTKAGTSTGWAEFQDDIEPKMHGGWAATRVLWSVARPPILKKQKI
jgi:hypothetical protein